MAKITRRDFLNGALLAAGATMIPPMAMSNKFLNLVDPEYYPPSLTGMRGSTESAYKHAHARAWGAKSDWGSVIEDDDEYDLIIVGGGVSGLSAAHFYQKEHGDDKKILILENHDDFGGHARRKEHHIDGKMVIGSGGSQSLQYPSQYSDITKELLDDINVDVSRFDKYYDQSKIQILSVIETYLDEI